MEKKQIRFIDSHYNEKFRLNDGENIILTKKDGRKTKMKCNYIDEYHLKIDNQVFHICELAEILERNGDNVEPLNAMRMNSKKKNRNYER